jgi:type IV pilus assembly protein PilP
MLSNYRKYLLLVLITSSLLLSGCGERKQLRELQKYVAQLKQNNPQQPKKESLLKDLNQPAPVTYSAANMRSPFSASSSSGSSHVESRHPLQNFQLVQLHFKGTVTEGDNTWAFVLAPDNKLYQVKLGDMIGDHYGKIISISQTSLVVQEQIDQLIPVGKPNTKIVTLQLKGPS